jgi:hypothetical protein
MDIMVETKNYVVAEDKSLTDKDSSRMLQAGAHRSYYIQARNEHLLEAFGQLLAELDISQPVVVESGGLYDFIEPSVLVHIAGERPGKNTHFRPETNRVILTSDEVFKNNRISVRFINHKFEPDA